MYSLLNDLDLNIYCQVYFNEYHIIIYLLLIINSKIISKLNTRYDGYKISLNNAHIPFWDQCFSQVLYLILILFLFLIIA